MGIGRMGRVIRGMSGAVVNSLYFRHGHWHGCFMTKMLFGDHCLDVIGYCFSSNLLVLHRRKRHPGRHSVARPAAQEQQGDHENEKQGTHI